MTLTWRLAVVKLRTESLPRAIRHGHNVVMPLSRAVAACAQTIYRGASRFAPGLLVALCVAAPARAEEFIYLGSGPLLGDRARQQRLQSGPGPSPGWQGADFDDSAWGLPDLSTTAPGVTQVLRPPPGRLAPNPDAGLPPPCQGALYLRRRFDVGPELSRLASLALRLRYEDGFAAYLNGVEVARRRLPESAQTDAATLATDRRPVEVESYYLAVTPGLLRPRDNVLALQVHPRALDRCPRVDAELSASDGARVVRGPYLEQVAEDFVDLAVASDVPTTLSVRYGRGETRGPKDRSARDATPSTTHRVRITGLRAATTYHYQVALQLPSGAITDLPEAAFHTPPARGRPLTLVVYGDSRSGHEVHARTVQSILAEDPDLVLHTGDAVERGTEDGDWDRFFTVAGPLLRRVAVYMSAGNHEYARKGQGALRLFDLFATMFAPQADPTRAELGGARLPRDLYAVPTLREGQPDEGDRGYYSLDVAGVHIVSLDSNQLRSPRQLRWLDADLQRANERRARAIFVYAHEGPYSMGLHGDNATIIRDYVPVLERHNVTLYFSGHDHDYERGRRGRLNYIVTGGGGAELRALRCGVPGKRPCKHTPAAFVNDHNYVRVEVQPGGQVRVCAKQIDGTPLEPCQIISR